MGTGKKILGLLMFVIGLGIFVDDLHDFVPGTEWLHWMPDFTPVIIGTFHLEHLYIGALIMLIGILVLARSSDY
ncbi:MAG: hypothetical protein KAT22_01060 [Candidatus Thorarchaeota archaeon]|nr:hypothetical protein [Candidatus Thorarchaeota archaeon]